MAVPQTTPGVSWDFSKLPAFASIRADRRHRSSALASPSVLQPKLAIGPVDDPLEREADRIADQVAAGPAGSPVSDGPPRIQRAAGTNANRETISVPASVNRALATGGVSLEPSIREDFGRRFGHDFSAVRVHSDDAAARSARDLNARAYTVGNTIVFGEGQFAPRTAAGGRLLAHELTHTIQQGGNAGLQPKLIQRDLAIDPTVAAPAAVVLTEPQMRGAIRFNSVLFTDAAEIAVLRDVLGIAKLPSVIDEDFVNAVIRYQAGFGLKPDGELGAKTAARLEQEITAEADDLAQPPTGTPLRRVARRLHLRSMTSRTQGTATHQGFVGPDANPQGAVTARTGDQQGGANNAISIEYTGENADHVDWLQFINIRMTATPVGAAAPVFNAGNVATSGGNVVYSNAAMTNWFVDAVPAPGASPLYNVSGGLNTRAAGRRLAMFDQPGGPTGLPLAQAFTAAGAAAAGAPQVALRMGFDSYVVRANRARYHVAWAATTTYNITAGTSGNIAYAQGAAGTVTGLQAVHRTALLAEYPGNPIT